MYFAVLFSWPWLVTGSSQASGTVILTVDVDGDGDADVVNHADGRLAWRANDGRGNLATPAPLGLRHFLQPRALAAGDLDGDGDPDVLVVDNSMIWWTENVGGGVGPEHLLVAVEGGAFGIVGDVDGDGDIDLIAGEPTYTVLWFENLGHGVFHGPETLSSGDDNQRDAVLADLDGDGDLDLVTLDDDFNAYDNLGSGCLGPPVTLSVDDFLGSDPSSITAADFDDDGDVDLGGGNFLSGPGQKQMWYESTGNGAFLRHDLGGMETYDVTAADLDGDLDLDLVMKEEEDVAWFENLGGGVFGPRRHYPLAGRGVAVADLDGDGDVDLVGTDGVILRTTQDVDHDGLSDSFEPRIGTDPARADTDGDGVKDGEEARCGANPKDPDPDPDCDGAGTGAERIAGTEPLIADSDGDGLDDGKELDRGSDPLDPDTDGDGGADGREIWCGTSPVDPATPDADCDGLDTPAERALGTSTSSPDTDIDCLTDGDEVISQTDPLNPDTDGGGLPDGWEVAVLGQPADRGDDWLTRTSAGAPLHVEAHTRFDVDGDGDEDVVAGHTVGAWEVQQSRVVQWFENVGGARYTPRDLVPADWEPRFQDMIGTDVDADGWVDLVVLDSQAVSWVPNLGGTFGPVRVIEILGSTPVSVRAGDLSCDGVADLVVTTEDAVVWYPNDGGDFGPARPIVDVPQSDAELADSDGDLDLDLVVAEYGGVYLFENAGGGRFLTRHPVAVTHPSSEVEWVDVDGDDRLDVVTIDKSGDTLHVIRNLGPDTWAPPELVFEHDEDVGNLVLGDVDGDRRPDIVVTSDKPEYALNHEALWFANPGTPGPWGTPLVVAFGWIGDIALDDLDEDGHLDLSRGVWWHENHAPDDPDSDGLSSPTELANGSDPDDPDTDGDGDLDGHEARCRSNPLDPADSDLDCDGLGDADEGFWGADPNDPDTDGDSLPDGPEVYRHGTDPAAPDSDGGGTSDYVELCDGRNPNRVGDDWTAVALPPGEQVAAGDFDGDGDLDVALGSTKGRGLVWVEAIPSGFGEINEIADESVDVADLASADLDGDGDDDLLVAGTRRTVARAMWIEGGPIPVVHPLVPGLADVTRVTAADLDADGVMDALACADSGLWSVTGQGAGVFGAPVKLTGRACGGGLEVADVTGDGDLDLVAGGVQGLWLMIGHGGVFDPPFALGAATDLRSLSIDDMDDDGDPDVLVLGSGVAWLELVGRLPPVIHLVASDQGTVDALVAVDLDADGWLDLAHSGAKALLEGRRNMGGGAFTGPAPLSPVTGFGGVEMLAVDLDADGLTDLVRADPDGSTWHRNSAR